MFNFDERLLYCSIFSVILFWGLFINKPSWLSMVLQRNSSLVNEVLYLLLLLKIFAFKNIIGILSFVILLSNVGRFLAQSF